MTIDDIMQTSPVIPVLVIDALDDAVPIAEALVAGGLRVLEVTLRTPVALDAIAAMSQVRGAIVGAGTVLNEPDLDASLAAGAEFIVSPGLTASLGQAAVTSGIPFLPGVSSASDIMRGYDLGLDRFKFFPAMASGGVPALRALSGPFGKARFCPTGGINEAAVSEWLAEQAVLCVGGSWIVPKGPVDAAEIESRARRAVALKPLQTTS